jgi:hypothetical protein
MRGGFMVLLSFASFVQRFDLQTWEPESYDFGYGFKVRLRGFHWLNLVWAKEEPVAGLSLLSEISAWVIFDNHGQMDAVFIIAFNRLNDGCSAFEHEVKDVGSAARLETDPLAAAQLDVVHVNGLQGIPTI